MKFKTTSQLCTARTFNLIEITLALGVIAIGIVGILGLFPVGLNASRDAMGQTSSAQTADELLAYLEQTIRGSWPADGTAWDAVLPAAQPSPQNNVNLSTDSPLQGTNGTIYAGASPGQYRLIRFVNVDGILDANGDAKYDEATDIKDFDAVMVVWRTQVDVGAATPVDYSFAVGLNAAISWPTEMPPESRQWKTFYLELFNR